MFERITVEKKEKVMQINFIAGYTIMRTEPYFDLNKNLQWQTRIVKMSANGERSETVDRAIEIIYN